MLKKKSPLRTNSPSDKLKESIEIIGAQKRTSYVGAKTNIASEMHKTIAAAILKFQEELPEDKEVGAILAQFGQTILIHVTGVAYKDPALMIFRGVLDDGGEVELLQHTSQVNLLLAAVSPLEGHEPRRIGFDLSS
jgi:hypothetical protein